MANKVHCDVCDGATGGGAYKTTRAVNLVRQVNVEERLPVRVRVNVEVRLEDTPGDICWMCGLEAIKKLEVILNE